jgi:hypothetical protein
MYVSRTYIHIFIYTGYFPLHALLSSHRTVHTIDFSEVTDKELLKFDIDFSFRIDKTAIMHGLAGWFDLDFIGTFPISIILVLYTLTTYFLILPLIPNLLSLHHARTIRVV